VATEPGEARERLLERCVAYVLQAGFSELSLREIAAGTGTSHRMLIYHFGSREGLLAEIVGRIEAQTRDLLADVASQPGELIDICWAFWHRVSDPSLAAAERLFFEVYAHALHDRPWTRSFRESVIAAWEQPLTELFEKHGFAHGEAADRARLALAVSRGLLMDVLMTGERDRVDAAMELLTPLLTQPGVARRPPRTRSAPARAKGPADRRRRP
jgi:AcrR family transcriptional regulator